ncbi:DUF3293 domain-containing protein [Flavobacteriaceae bacterium]|nr:DUF3293 domain-containing protein [Flavobacteriaceae bacterium]
MNSEFTEYIKIKVVAAQIGISNDKWDSVGPEISNHEALQILQDKSYHVLPIVDTSGKCVTFWELTTENGLVSAKKKSIEDANKISYLTDLKELLYQFKQSESNYFYLTESGNINGLVSQVNLNSKPVYTYFYNLLSYCEIELGLWVKSLINEDEIISLISKKSNQSSKDLSFEVFKRYSYDKKNNTQNHIVEYVYFTQFEYILKKKKLVSTLGYQSNSDFSKDFKLMSRFRNWIAHPINSVTENLKNDLFLLHKSLDRLIENLTKSNIELNKSYLSTTFQVKCSPPVNLKIGYISKEMKDLLLVNDYYEYSIITAENPFSNSCSEEINKARNTSLIKLLEKQRFKYFETLGVPADNDWIPENSFLVFNMSKDKAKKLCKEFEQNAFVYGSVDSEVELVWVNT